MDNDDVQTGRLLTRREMLALMGAAGLVAAVGCSSGSGSGGATATAARTSGAGASPTSALAVAPTGTAAGVPACVVVPALTEGPYFVDEKLNRSDIRSDPGTGAVKDGTPLDLAFAVSAVSSGCTPLAGATVDVWHCDALGVYSDTQDPSFNTVGQKFLRGYQVTDAQGRASFRTIYPGWYQGRAVHIHFKIRADGTEFTSQLFFDDALTDQVHAQAPYAQKGSGRLPNSGDSIFQQSEGMLTLAPSKTADGYAATFEIGLRTT